MQRKCPAFQNTKSTKSFRKYISLLHSLQIYSFVSLNPLAPELSAWCTLQKMRKLNGHSLLCTFLASNIRCHLVFSDLHCTMTTVIFQCQELLAKYACLKKYNPLQMVHFQPLQLLAAHTGTELARWWTTNNNLCPCLFSWSSFVNGSKEHHPPEIQFKSQPANCNVHTPPASRGTTGACAMSMYSSEHFYTNNLKWNAVNTNRKTTIFLAQVVAHTAKKEREKEGKKEKRKKGEVRR